MTYHWRGKKWFLTLHIVSVKLKFLNKKPSLLMATLENVFSTWGNSRVQLFLSTCWCISLSLVAFGHSWYGEMHQRVLRKSWTLELPHVEKTFSNVAINKLYLFHMRQFEGSTFSQHKLMHFPISRLSSRNDLAKCIKKSNPQIVSSGKD